MTRNQIILANIFLAIPIVPVRLILLVLYWLTKWIHKGVEHAFDNFPSLIPIPKTQRQLEEEERKACERLARVYNRRKEEWSMQQKFLDDLNQDKYF